MKNVVDFGAFVEIGIKESALIHVSELSDRFVKDPMEVLKVGDVKEFRIISIDPVRKRIGLSLKSGSSRPAAPRREAAAAAPAGRPEKSYDKPRAPVREKEDDGMTYNPFADLLKKRNK